MSKDQKIIELFFKYRQCVKPFKKVVVQTLPYKGYYLDDDFFKHDEIVKEFKKAMQDLVNKKINIEGK